MSVRFNADSDRLVRSTSLPVWDGYTFCCFVQLVSNAGTYSALFSLEDTGSGGTSYHVLETEADGVTLWCFSGFTVAMNLGATFGPLSVGTWYFVGLTHDNSNIHGYLGQADSALALAATTSTTDANARSFDRMVVGGDGFNEPGDLRLAGVRIWDVVLTQDELENERRFVLPRRLANLNAHYPLLSEAEKLVDFSGNGRGLSTAGAGTWESDANPPVPFRRARSRLILPAATTNYVLTAEPGAVSIAGTDAFLLQQARLVADPGAVALAGSSTSLVAAHALGADPGAVAITGQNASLQAELNLQADSGAVAVAGADADLVAAHRLVADPGAVVITGMDAALRVQSAGVPRAVLTLKPAPQAQMLVQPEPRAILTLK